MDVRTGAIIEGDDEAIERVDRDLRKARGTTRPQLIGLSQAQHDEVRQLTMPERIAWAAARQREQEERAEKRRAQRLARRRQRRRG